MVAWRVRNDEKENAGFSRDDLSTYLERHQIQTRNLFAGNLIKHPCFDEMRERQEGYRVVGELKRTDYVMNHLFWVGMYPGMIEEKMDYMSKIIYQFVREQ